MAQDDMEDYDAYNGEEADSSGSEQSDGEDDEAEASDGDEQGRRPQHAKRGAAEAPGKSSKAKRRRPMNIEYEMEHEMEPLRGMQSMQQ